MKTIVLDKVNKEFNLDKQTKSSLLGHLLSLIESKFQKPNNLLKVMDDINLEFHAGEVVGLLGLNGSGKSTLLRLIAGIYKPTSGKMKTTGELLYLTGFGQGIVPRLTMRENIYLIGALFGLNKKKIDLKIAEIISFSELEEYLDVKVYKFSSGMVNRLSFSTTFFCAQDKEPDIILIDEALDAGADLFFKDKAIKEIEKMILGKATVIMASHDMEKIKKYCQRAIWLDKGRIMAEGSAEKVVGSYLEKN